MNQFVDRAYDVTSQLFGPDSEIPWWAWLLVVVALLWRLLIPERQTAQDRDAALAATMVRSGNGGSGKKRDRKRKK